MHRTVFYVATVTVYCGGASEAKYPNNAVANAPTAAHTGPIPGMREGRINDTPEIAPITVVFQFVLFQLISYLLLVAVAGSLRSNP